MWLRGMSVHTAVWNSLMLGQILILYLDLDRYQDLDLNFFRISLNLHFVYFFHN